MTNTVKMTRELIDALAGASDETVSSAEGPDMPVALHLRQRLQSVEDHGDGRAVIYPPTYADIGYNIDTLADGTTVALIDSVGSQANRMEPLFKELPLSGLVPQIEIKIPRTKKKSKGKSETDGAGPQDEADGGDTEPLIRSLLDLSHRAGDAVVLSCPDLAPSFRKAFHEVSKGNAEPLAKLAPTSLLFGVWNSRGTQEKLPRLLRSEIRAYDCDVLHAAAQYNSVWKLLGELERETLEKDRNAKKLADSGFKDVPATFRKLGPTASREMRQFQSGAPNPNARVLGGIVAREIVRKTTINLAALRRLEGPDEEATKRLRRYLLSLALIVAMQEPKDMYLREGCHLRFAEPQDSWALVPMRGAIKEMHWTPSDRNNTLLPYAQAAYTSFGKGSIACGPYNFDVREAQKLLAKLAKSEDDGEIGP